MVCRDQSRSGSDSSGDGRESSQRRRAFAVPPLRNSTASGNITFEGSKDPEGTRDVLINWVSPEYLKTVGTPLVAGRYFDDRDREDAAKTAIINEELARRFAEGRSPIGLRLAMGSGNALQYDIEVVGVVRNSKYRELKEKDQPILYLPYRQGQSLSYMCFFVKTQTPSASVGTAVREAVRRMDPALPVFDMMTMQEGIDQSVAGERVLASLSASFGGLAVLLSALGLYGLMAYSVSRRQRDLGIRLALGADGKQLMTLVLREALGLVAIGLLLGAALGLGLGRFVESELFGLKASDPGVVAAAGAVLFLAGVLAAWIPAQRVLGLNPLQALRHE